MKRTALMLLVLLTVSCTKNYKMTIYEIIADDSRIAAIRSENEVVVDIKALNDTRAYGKAIEEFRRRDMAYYRFGATHGEPIIFLLFQEGRWVLPPDKYKNWREDYREEWRDIKNRKQDSTKIKELAPFFDVRLHQRDKFDEKDDKDFYWVMPKIDYNKDPLVYCYFKIVDGYPEGLTFRGEIGNLLYTAYRDYALYKVRFLINDSTRIDYTPKYNDSSEPYNHRFREAADNNPVKTLLYQMSKADKLDVKAYFRNHTDKDRELVMSVSKEDIEYLGKTLDFYYAYGGGPVDRY